MNALQAALVLGKSERTVRAWLKSGKLAGQKRGRDWEIAAEVLAGAPALSRRVGNELQELRAQVSALEERLAALEVRRALPPVFVQRDEPETLREVVPALRRSVSRSVAEGMPDGLVICHAYALAHGVAGSTVRHSIEARRLPVVQGNWKVGNNWVKTALDVEGQRVLHTLWKVTPCPEVCAVCAGERRPVVAAAGDWALSSSGE